MGGVRVVVPLLLIALLAAGCGSSGGGSTREANTAVAPILKARAEEAGLLLEHFWFKSRSRSCFRS